MTIIKYFSAEMAFANQRQPYTRLRIRNRETANKFKEYNWNRSLGNRMADQVQFLYNSPQIQLEVLWLDTFTGLLFYRTIEDGTEQARPKKRDVLEPIQRY